MHPKSFVSNFWGAVHLLFMVIVGGYGIPAIPTQPSCCIATV